MPAETLHPLTEVLNRKLIVRTRFAEKIGYSEEHLSRVENGRLPASPEFRRRCADALDLPESALFRDPEPATEVRS